MKSKFKYILISIVSIVLITVMVAFLDKSCMAHYYFERMMGHEYPNISGYHRVTVDEMNGTTDRDKEQKIKKLMMANKINGIVLFGDIAQKPNIVESSQNEDSKIGPNVLYPIASLQKVYTGIAIQKLINEHKVCLSTTLNKFYPNIPYSNKITIGDLLSHLSGIDDGNQQTLTVLKNENDTLSFIEKNLNSTGKIGKWNYSDSDYALLAGIISKLSGMSYQSYISKNIIIPYKLKNTKFYNQVNNKTDVISGNVQSMGNGLCFENLKKKMSVALGAGGMFSSAIDYWNFINYLTSNKIIPLGTITSSSNKYYDGVYLGKGTFHADGSMNGCQSCFIMSYDSNQTFILFSNNISFKQMLNIRGKLADICFE
ncbi:serine hydrolase domain-containing protein [Ligilactobacillus araffinosus]|nr:serine hydrolase domain-containing protein [Ligilactobacillus araffinosus]